MIPLYVVDIARQRQAARQSSRRLWRGRGLMAAAIIPVAIAAALAIQVLR